MLPKDFYVVPEDVFRLGNADGPRLDHVRSRDVDTTTIDGVQMVIANGKGISLFDREGIRLAPFTGWVWKVAAATSLPPGLKLVQDKPHHYCIAPASNMPVTRYKSLLEQLALSAQRVMKIPGTGTL